MTDLPLYLLVSFVACVTPGSGVLYTITSGFCGGLRCALASPLGTALGCALMAAVSATGLGALIAGSPAAYAALQIVSALVLVWLGLQNWRAGVPAAALGRDGKEDKAEKEGGQGGRPAGASFFRIFWGAVVLQASNVMLIVFLLSLMPPFIRTDAPYLPQVALLSTLFVVVCFFVHLGYSLLCAAGAKVLAGPRFTRILNRTSAALFWLLAASVLWNALPKA